MLKSFKVRLDLSEEQYVTFSKLFGCYRLVYNQILNHKIEYYDTNKTFEPSSELSSWVQHILLKNPEYPFLKEFSTNILKTARNNVDTAYTNFYKHKSGFPKFKSKNKNKNSVKFLKTTISWNNLSDGKLHLTKNIRDLEFVCSYNYREIILKHKDEIKSIVISREPSNQMFASILIESDNIYHKILPETINPSIGIDLGLKELMVLSTGEVISNPNITKNLRKKLSKLQRRHSRTTKVSKNREKCRLKLAKCWKDISNMKNNFSHELTSRIISENQVIIIEDLNISGMLKNHKLARSIQDISWGEFIRQLQYKAEWYGKELIFMDRFFPSSKICSCCGYKKDSLLLSERTYNCENCGISIDRDYNAAKNIETEGLKILEKTGKWLPVESV